MKVSSHFCSIVNKWQNFVIVSIYFAFTIMQSSIYGALNIELTRALELSAVGFSALSSIFFGTVALVLIPFGIIYDKQPLRKILLLSAGISVISAFALYVSQTYIICMLNRVACGIANASAFIGGLQLINTCYKKNNMLLTGLFFMIGNIGSIIVLGPYIYLKTIISWQDILLVNFILILVIFVFMFFWIKKQNFIDRDNALMSGFDMLCNVFKKIWYAGKDINNWLCGIYTGLLGLPQNLLVSLWGVIYLTRKFDLTETQAGVIIIALIVGIIIGSAFSGWLAAITNNIKKILQIATLFCLMLILSIMYIDNMGAYLLFVLFFLLGISASVQVLTISSIQANSPRRNVNTAISFAALLTNVIITTAYPIFGYLIDNRASSQIAVYMASNFKLAMMIFPIGFIVSLFLAWAIEDVFAVRNRS